LSISNNTGARKRQTENQKQKLHKKNEKNRQFIITTSNREKFSFFISVVVVLLENPLKTVPVKQKIQIERTIEYVRT